MIRILPIVGVLVIVALLGFVGAIATMYWPHSGENATKSYRYELSLQVNGEVVEFKIPWRCKLHYEFPNMVSGDFIEKVMEPTVEISAYARKLNNGATLVVNFHPPCFMAHGGDADDALIRVFDNATDRPTLQVFTKQQRTGIGYRVEINTSHVFLLDAPEPDYVRGSAEHKLLTSIGTNCSGYEQVLAGAIAAEDWSYSDIERTLGEQADSAGSAPHILRLPDLSIPTRFKVYSIPLVRTVGTWRLPEISPDDLEGQPEKGRHESYDRLANVYFRIPGPPAVLNDINAQTADMLARPRPAIIQLDDTDDTFFNIQLTGNRTPMFYYPKNHWIIWFVNQRLSCASLMTQ